MAAGRLNQKALTKFLGDLGQQVHTVDDDGNPITREAALAQLLWNKALGYEEKIRDDNGTEKVKKHPPESWAMQYIWERREGKSVPMIAENEGGIRASDKVRALSRERINAMATSLAAASVPKGPPRYNPKKG